MNDAHTATTYAYIVAANTRYLPGLNAIINSLDLVGNTHDLHVLNWQLPRTYLDAALSADLSYRVIFHDITPDEVAWLGESEVLMRKRYALPSLLGYDAYCILDADMFFCHNVDRYLEIAHKTGLVLGCTLEMKRRYGDKNHQYPAGSDQYLIDPEFWNARDLACAPLFVGREWLPALKRSYDIVNDHPPATGEAWVAGSSPCLAPTDHLFTVNSSLFTPSGRFLAPDMDALNICLIAAGSYDRTIPLSQHTWTGLHECMMKAHTRAVEQHGRLFTEDGEEINIVHGQFWNPTWRGWQIENQMRMIDREFDGIEPYRRRSMESFDLLCRWFENISGDHKIAIDHYS